MARHKWFIRKEVTSYKIHTLVTHKSIHIKWVDKYTYVSTHLILSLFLILSLVLGYFILASKHWGSVRFLMVNFRFRANLHWVFWLAKEIVFKPYRQDRSKRWHYLAVLIFSEGFGIIYEMIKMFSVDPLVHKYIPNTILGSTHKKERCCFISSTLFKDFIWVFTNTVKLRVEVRVTIQKIKSLGVLKIETCI